MKSKTEVNHQAWSESLIGFIRSKGLERELADWCGGWKCPIPDRPKDLVHRFEMESMALHKNQREWLEREIAKLLTATPD